MGIRFSRFSSKNVKNRMFRIKKCFLENAMLKLGAREKKLCGSLDDVDDFWEVV